MTQAPPGWYPDPQGTPPGHPPRQRWWDGRAWTGYVHPPEPGQQPGAGQQQPVEHGPTQQSGEQADQPTGRPGPYGGVYGQPAQSRPAGQAYGAQQPYGNQQPYGGYPSAPQYGGQPRATTPDGAPLSGWWRRVGAYVIDGVILAVVNGIVSLPFETRYASAIQAWSRKVNAATLHNTALPSVGSLYASAWRPLVAIAVIALILQLLYFILLERFTGQTLGKMVTGIQVRPLAGGTLTTGAVVRREVGRFGLATITLGLFSIFDDLWPLGERHNQALHDKFGATVVVHKR